MKKSLIPLLLAGLFSAQSASAAVSLIAKGSLSGSLPDLSGLSSTLEDGAAGNLLGGLGSGLAWAGGDTFLALPDRGPNASTWNSAMDNTTSYIPRFQTIKLALTANNSGTSLPFQLTPTLTGTTLLYSDTALNYGAVTPTINTANKFYFSGRSDNFATGVSTNPANARLDPEGIRLSNDGKHVYITDEYGPYVYQFDRTTGQRTNTYTLPANFAIANLTAQGATEISGNTSGRVANKGMEGLAITPDGKTLVGFEQSPLIQDGGDGGRANRIVTIDTLTGNTHQYAYDNFVSSKNKSYNSSEMLALNDHEFLVLERDGKGLGDGSNAALKQIYKVDISGATDVSGLSGEAALLAKAPTKSLFLDIKSVLNANGITDDLIPAKLEGMAFGEDVTIDGILKHTLYIANDNDFLATSPDGKSNPNQWFVFAFDATDLGNSTFVQQQLSAVPEPETYAMLIAGLGLLGFTAQRRNGK